MRNKLGFFYRSRPGRCRLCGTRTGTCQTPQGKHEVRCPGCGKHSREYPKRRQAIAAWNLRA